MRVCKYCGTALEKYDQHGNEWWHCPNDCAALKALEQLEQVEGAKSDAQILAEYEDMMAVAGNAPTARMCSSPIKIASFLTGIPSMFYIGHSSVYFRLVCPLCSRPFPHISAESCMETRMRYANTIILKVLYPVNGKSGIKLLEICKK